MLFTGDLAQLPIVDVIQLIHSTRKSGTLTIQSQKGESHLGFSDGYLVSANHLNNSVRIGQILVENKFITPEAFDKSLLEQKIADGAHKPLIRILVEQGSIQREDAYRGLEALIEMTVVEALTWTRGTFSMDLDYIDISDEYRYFPGILHQEMLLNSQQILMEALRIYDEKMRDGTLENIFFSEGTVSEKEVSISEDGNLTVTADMLGLDTLDTLSQKIPDRFFRLEDKDYSEEHRRIIADELFTLPRNRQDELCSFLTQISLQPSSGKQAMLPGALSIAVIMFSHDTFMKYALSTICKNRHHVVFTTDDDVSLDLFIDQSFSRGHMPILVVDDPVYIGEGYEERTASMLQEKREKYPRLSILQLSSLPENQTLQPHGLDEGATAILPRPVLGDRSDSFVARITNLLLAFRSVLDKSFVQPERLAEQKLKEVIATLTAFSEPREVARELLSFTSSFFERAVTLVAGPVEMTVEKGIGVTAKKSSGPTGPLMLKVPLGQQSVLDDVIEKQSLFYGHCSDPTLGDHLYAVISAPRSPKILLLPLMMTGKVIALIYADFGQLTPTPVLIEHLDILSRVAGLVLDKSYHQKRFELMTKPR
ncbi:MAG: DUF4388 domain-containing protein [Desulfuromonadaceae bacterium]|nr:DUF4388 domain-containing protein [Desulfuromonadaceae bacterium]